MSGAFEFVAYRVHYIYDIVAALFKGAHDIHIVYAALIFVMAVIYIGDIGWNRCAEGRLSNESKRRIAAMLSIDSEIESIADTMLGVGKILLRKQQSNVWRASLSLHDLHIRT